ncbi:alpha/beta fold hydrolase, partial [Myxococcota bacterium]|nr:alpha/beta fold hydrolase [Myxococcota bacterium]
HGPGGASAPGPATFDDEVEHLARTIDALTATRTDHRVILAGYSLGARLALRVAVRHPTKIEHLVLASGSAGLEGDDAREARRADDRRWIELLRTGGLARFVDAWTAQPVLAPGRAIDDERRAEHDVMRFEHDADGLARAMDVLGLGAMPDTWPDLATLAVPVTIAAGARDAKFCAIAARMVAIVPAAHLAIVDGAGHDLVLEAPEELARLVADAARARDGDSVRDPG